MAAAQPRIERRTEQPYVAIKALVTMQNLGEILPGLHPEVNAWLRSRGASPAGDPFFKYNVVHMDSELEVEVGFPVSAAVTADRRVLAGVLPRGRYATLRHYGHPNGLIDATVRLLDWAMQQGLAWDVEQTADGRRWVARLEIYQDVPPPDMDAWQTDLAFKVAD
jgi:effector-binding domain-containing protein